MELVVLLGLIVVVVKHGTKQLFSVIALLILIGMDKVVFSVKMENIGTKIQELVNVLVVLSGMDSFVLSYKIVLEV